MGKQIRIYLADGSATGIRHAEITNWTGQALACPRARFGELRDWKEIQRPGVYFLFGIDDESGDEAVYIGESEMVFDRLASHMAGKEFWSELIAFTSKDDNLTKAHIKYLESRLISLANTASRYRITNSVFPQNPALPRADQDSMEEYIGSVRTLLGVLGHRVLEPYSANIVSSKTQTVQLQSQESEASTIALENLNEPSESITFFLNMGDARAIAVKTEEGLVVLAGAIATELPKTSLSGGYRLLREKLIGSGVLVAENGKFRLQHDRLFTSPSQAAAIFVGYSVNGRDAWKTKDGVTYGMLEQRLADTLLKQLDK